MTERKVRAASEKHATSYRLKMWFEEGVQDALDGAGMSKVDDPRWSQRSNAWEAYRAGYETGRAMNEDEA